MWLSQFWPYGSGADGINATTWGNDESVRFPALSGFTYFYRACNGLGGPDQCSDGRVRHQHAGKVCGIHCADWPRSAGLSRLSESFDYSVQGLIATFGKRITAHAAVLGRQPGERMVPLERQIRIANIVYANRCGNGDVASGDGWRYRGGGLKQVTFHDNYATCATALSVDCVSAPPLLSTDRALAARSAGWFWYSIGGNVYADRGDFDGLSTRINGAGISVENLAARRVRWAACKSVLGVACPY